MRILLTTDTVGGVWTFTRELTSDLLRRGHAVCLVAFGVEPSLSQTRWLEQTAASFPRSFNVRLSTVPLEWMQGNADAFAHGADVLARCIDVFKPDLLHSSQFCFGAFQGTTHGQVRLPCVVTAHSDVLSWAEACRPEGLAPSAWLDEYIRLVQQGLAHAAAVVAPTQWMADTLRRHFPFGPRPEVILNGRSLPVLGARRPFAEEPHRRLQAVTAGRLWDEAKNLRMLASIDSPVPIHVAGDQTFGGGEPHLQTVPGHLIVRGRMAEEELFALFRESRIYLATSAYEPFGLAPLEAALCGCSVVANDLASLREVWGDAALYFRTPEALADLLSQLAASPGRLEKAREASFARARELTAERTTEAYLSLYERLIEAAPQLRAPAREPAAAYAL